MGLQERVAKLEQQRDAFKAQFAAKVGEFNKLGQQRQAMEPELQKMANTLAGMDTAIKILLDEMKAPVEETKSEESKSEVVERGPVKLTLVEEPDSEKLKK